jgi:tetratricopeptide (TPR) repeat protein
MRCAACFITICAVLCCFTQVQAKDADAYIEEAQKLNGAGKIAEAISLLQQALEEHPEEAGIHAYLGLYTGMSAGRTEDYVEAMRLVTESFTMLDKAISLAPEKPIGYLFRGIMGVQIPPFLGKLDGGINDLKHVIDMHEGDAEAVSDETLVTAYTHLAAGYEKQEAIDRARGALEKIIELAPGTAAAAAAEKHIAGLAESVEPKADALAPRDNDPAEAAAIKRKLENGPENTALIMKLGEVYYGGGMYREAVPVLKRYVEIDGTSADAYKMLGISVAMVAQEGYNENIHQDTDYLSGLVFESIGYMDRAVELDPDDAETRLVRGIFGITFPFFVGKHEQGVEDLEYVTKSEASDSMKAEALYYLGVAKQREAMRYWIKVARDYPDEEAVRMVYREMRPAIPRFDPSQHEEPFVKIDFVLGFRDELPPQTAVWVEDADGAYVTTVYVSGFSGHAKEKQVNLPVWSEMSKFEGVEAVTSASIDVGHHIYTWDMTDMDGERVGPGTYTVRVEVAYWPTMKYQLAETSLTVGKKKDHAVVEEGDYIPYMAVTYYPE